MYQSCKHSNCAVCADEEGREILKSIFGISFPETYVCKNAVYKVTNSNGSWFVMPSLNGIKHSDNGYFVIDMYTSMIIYLNKDNLEVICDKNDNVECKPKLLNI